MEALPKSRLLRFVEQAMHLARRAVARYSSKFSKRRYTLHQHIVLLCLKVRKNTTYRTLLDELIEMPRIRSAIDLEELPSPSTLCKAFNRLGYGCLAGSSQSLSHASPDQRCRRDRRLWIRPQSASKHYTKRTKLTIQRLKVTLLVDTRVNAIIDLHVTTTRKHDSKIAPSLIRRNTDDVTILLGDKGYDDQKIRTLAREDGVRPVIKHRGFSSLHKAWNVRLDADIHGQRSQNETVNSRIKRKYGEFVRSRRWWKQFRELVVGCLTHNIDKAL